MSVLEASLSPFSPHHNVFWDEVPYVSVGPNWGADTYLRVTRDGEPIACLHIGAGQGLTSFSNVIVWCDRIVVGYGRHVHMFDPDTMETSSYALQGYFGYLYPQDEGVLASGMSELLYIGRDGLRWRAGPLGLDGVLVHETVDDIIRGDGEWDPPGGWRPFEVRLDSGEILLSGGP